MAIATKVTCDVCGKEKQAVNHWWLRTKSTSFFELVPWYDDDAATKGHLCGQECAIKALSEWMQKTK